MTVGVGAADAEDVRARLALRAMAPGSPTASASGGLSPPPSPAAGSPAALRVQKEVTVGVRVIVREDFMSDSGAADKVLLKRGQSGVVKRINDSGHASINFEDHKKLQWVTAGNLRRLATERELEEPAPPPSLLRRRVLEQLNEAFDGGFARRLAKMQEKFELIKVGPPTAEKPRATAAPAASPAAPAPAAPSPAQSASTEPLREAVLKALRSRPLPKGYGPTERQEQLPPVEDRQEEIVDESYTLGLTLQSLEQNIASRRRQVASLQQQVDTLQGLARSVCDDAEAAARHERALAEDPSSVLAAHEEALGRRRREVAELTAELRKVEGSANRCRAAFRQQRRFLHQSNRIMQIIGETRVARHPAGEVFLAMLPPPFDEEQPESWDVGTAIANPYNVDSWPFEPNVLASRRSFNGELEEFEEETQADIDEENRRFRSPFLPGLELPSHMEEAASSARSL